MDGFPPALKPIVGLVKQAQSLKKADTTLAYYVLLWAAQKGMTIRAANNTPEVTKAILGLLDEIESLKNTLKLPAMDKDYVLERSFKAFLHADNADRAGTRTKATAAAFRTAAMLFETLKQFGELPGEVADRMKYAVFRASHIMTKLAAGEEPDAPPSASAEEDELNELAAQDPAAATGGAPSFSMVPAAAQPFAPAPHFPSVPAGGGGGGGGPAAGSQFPSVPTGGAGGGAPHFPSVPSGGGGGGAAAFPSVPSGGSHGGGVSQFPSVPSGGAAVGSGAPVFPSVPTGAGGSGGASHFTGAGGAPQFPASPGGGGGGLHFPTVPAVPFHGAPPSFPSPPAANGGGGMSSYGAGAGAGASLFPSVSSAPAHAGPVHGASPSDLLAFPSVPGGASAPPPYHALASGTAGNLDLFGFPAPPGAGQVLPSTLFPSVPAGPTGTGAGGPPSGAPPHHDAPPPQQPKPAAQPAAPKAVVKPAPAPVQPVVYDDGETEVPLAPSVRFGAQPPGYRPTMRQVGEAQKHAKMAYSALNFEDVKTAVENLATSLKNLTGIDYVITPAPK